MGKIIKYLGYSCLYDGHLFRTWKVFDRWYVHISREFRYPYISFMQLPF